MASLVQRPSRLLYQCGCCAARKGKGITKQFFLGLKGCWQLG